MIKGITVALPTFNRLEFLKLCLYSIKKYSSLPKTDVSIVVDGSTDGTVEWAEENDIDIIHRPKRGGAYSTWNIAAEAASNEYVFLAEDDFFFGPDWDTKIAAWINELGPNYVPMPQLAEPITAGSMPEAYLDCGVVSGDFDEKKFVEFCVANANRHELIRDPNGMWVLPKELFFSVGGFDLAYDPFTNGYIDCQLMLCKAHPQLRFVRVWDSIIYHLHHKDVVWLTGDLLQSKQEIHERNVQYFEKKWGFGIGQGYRSIPVD